MTAPDPRLRRFALLALAAVALGVAATQLSPRSEARSLAPPRPVHPVRLAAPAVVEPASRVIELQAQVQGRLARVTKESGDPVRRGELLAELENSVERANVALRRAELARAEAVLSRLEGGAREEDRRTATADLERAEAALEAAKIDLERAQTLVARGVRPAHALDAARATHAMRRAERDAARARRDRLAAGERPEVLSEARAEVERARAALALAEAQLAQTRILSPVDGFCVYRYREPGEVVGRQSDTLPVLSVAGVGVLCLRAEVDAADVGRVHVGQRVHATAPAYPGQTFSGTVQKLEPTLGRKNFRTGRPTEKIDTKVLEVVVALDPGQNLPLGLETTCLFLEGPDNAARQEEGRRGQGNLR